MKQIEDYFEEEDYTKSDLLDFLKIFKKTLFDYIGGKISDDELADIGNKIFVINDILYDDLDRLDPQSTDLMGIVDVTAPDWDIDQKKGHIEELIKLTDKLIKKHS